MPERRPAAPPLPTRDALTGHAFTMDLAAVKAAAARTAGRLHITPLLSSIGAAEALRRSDGPLLGDGRVRLKSEHLQRTGSYKVRGMLNRVTQMVEHFGEDEEQHRHQDRRVDRAVFAGDRAGFGAASALDLPERAL